MSTLYFMAGLGLGIIICAAFFWWIVNEELKEIDREDKKITWPKH